MKGPDKDKPGSFRCNLVKQGYAPGSCRVRVNGRHMPACVATLKEEDGETYRMITSIHLSRPENYLSIYQSGCNFSCRKCHSWYFSKVKNGKWYRPLDILEESISYEKTVTLVEPREKATAWHAHDTCRCCGRCILRGVRSESCPGALGPQSIRLSPQGFGPARNIVAFTGGGITCCPEFYGECARLIKRHTSLWLLIETNGYGLTPENLDYLRDSGVDAFWLDIKAHDPETHRWLTGCSNERIMNLPEEICKKGFVLEVLSLYIPDRVETQDLGMIARAVSSVDPGIPFTILAFFPEYRMKDFRRPTTVEMVEAYREVKSTGLTKVRLDNLGVFLNTEEDQKYLIENVDTKDF